MKKVFPLLVIVLLVFFGCIETDKTISDGNKENYLDPNYGKTLSIASWNLQVFGQKKASDPALMDYYAQKMKHYDIVVVQEIRDANGSAFEKLCRMLEGYKCIVSSRSGRTNSKEQYGILYRKAVLLTTIDYNSPENQAKFERPPFEAKFSFLDWNFSIVTIHTKPDDARKEMNYLEELLEDTNSETIILGDLNTDCSYYDENAGQDFEEWFWAIPDREDTTVSATECTYDRVILNKLALDNYLGFGIMKDVNREQSDHYLVWADFSAS